MSEDLTLPRYERRITPVERLFTRSPFSIVTMVARIKGTVTDDMLEDAVSKVQQRHPNLRVRIVEDEDRNPWFTSEGPEEIPVEIVPRESDEQWIAALQKASQIPFEFGVRPAIRFILLQSSSQSDLVIVCHHILCDGLSLAYLARDLMVHLGDPTREVDILPAPVPIDRDNIPSDVTLNPIAGLLINRMNKKWQKDPVFFDQQDYEDLSTAYWANVHHSTLPVELSAEETAALVDRCRGERVTVNSALTAAFVDAQIAAQGLEPHHKSIGIAGSLRHRMTESPGEAMGFYAGVVTLKHKTDPQKGFWESVRRLHRKAKSLLSDRRLFNDVLTWSHLDPSILEAMNFKKLGGLVPADAPRHEKLSAFATRRDVVQGILKQGRMDSLERVIMGTAITNLTRMDFPRRYGDLELERLILQPGGAFPLTQVGLVLGAVTCSGKLSLVLEYAEEAVDTSTMRQVKTKALELLLGERPSTGNAPQPVSTY